MLGMIYGGYVVWGIFMRHGLVSSQPWTAHAILAGWALVPIAAQWLLNRARRQEARE
jgi:hypothetical protein